MHEVAGHQATELRRLLLLRQLRVPRHRPDGELTRGLHAAGKPFLWVVRATEEAQLPRHLLDAAMASGDTLVVRWSPCATGCFVTGMTAFLHGEIEQCVRTVMDGKE
ncbi:hypothetical protein OsI_30719 [Oryza sativa Indica Group]|uniref:Uncharacterized protein n=1 Tax=Oryza sativa subsp. indica TaxID=39946 RepID=B8BE10_ORYSI|nr:hypothetical protein OsI_30719 [Oryza sativa Indica Group]